MIFPQDQSGFTVEDYQEIKQAVIERVIKPAKKGDWEVKNILTMNGVYGRQEDTVLIHKSAKLKYDNEGILIEDLGKIHYKSAFVDEEWIGIEEVLNKEETPQNPSEQYQAQQEEPPLWVKYMGYFYHRGNKY